MGCLLGNETLVEFGTEKRRSEDSGDGPGLNVDCCAGGISGCGLGS